VAFRARHSAQERPSTFLEVEMTEELAAILAPTIQNLSVQSILKDAGGAGATKKLARRKLNNAGAITNHCGLQKNPERVLKAARRRPAYGVPCGDFSADESD
jgi:hypothetical protein